MISYACVLEPLPCETPFAGAPDPCESTWIEAITSTCPAIDVDVGRAIPILRRTLKNGPIVATGSILRAATSCCLGTAVTVVPHDQDSSYPDSGPQRAFCDGQRSHQR